MTEKMRTKRGVQVPMDTDHISPDSLKAAFDMGVQTLLERATAAGDALDWATLEIGLQHSEIAADRCSQMVLRAVTL